MAFALPPPSGCRDARKLRLSQGTCRPRRSEMARKGRGAEVPCTFGRLRLRRRGRARPVQGAVSAASGMGRTAVWVPAEGDSAVQRAALCGVRSEQSCEPGSSRKQVRSAPTTARGISRPTHESGGVGGLLVKGLEGVGGGGESSPALWARPQAGRACLDLSRGIDEDRVPGLPALEVPRERTCSCGLLLLSPFGPGGLL